VVTRVAEWVITEEGATVAGTPSVEVLQEQLRTEQEGSLLLQETVADLELALEDVGWRKLSNGVASEFTADGRRRVSALCRLMAISHPLIKRGLTLRIGYIWGQGVEVTARVKDDEAVQAQVNELLDAFDADNEDSLVGSQACEELERAQGTDGNVYLALFTSTLTGRVQVRSTPTDEITDIICNPEDRDEPWFYVREYVTQVIEAGYQPGNTRTRAQTVKVAHPALGYRPTQKIKTLNGAQVRWDAPMLHVPVNRLDGWKYGIPDAYASIAWARMYRDFLVDWAGLTKALSKIAWKATGSNKTRAHKAATAVTTAAETRPHIDGRTDAGQTAVMGPGNTFEAVSKSGATIDSESGRPLAAMVAAGLGLPVTLLLADPGVTGARATAETLDKPTILEMGMRRLLWQSARERIYRHVIDSSVEAPRGMLRGRVLVDDWGRKHTFLDGKHEPVIEFTWPPLADLDPIKLIDAVVSAHDTQLLPDVTVVRLLLQLLGVPDVDDVMEAHTDSEGNWLITPASAGNVAADAFRRGDDPAAALA
jgi:hypothetical protein